MVTELGFDATPGTEHDEEQWIGEGRYRDGIVAYLENRGIGWIAWCFSPSWTPRLLLDDDFSPSESGEFFRSELMARAR